VRSSLAGQVNVFETEVRLHVALKETAKLGRSILETEPDSPSAASYRGLAREVLAALGEAPTLPLPTRPMFEPQAPPYKPTPVAVAVPAEPVGVAPLAPRFETFVEGWPRWLGNAS
jgi:hypothetical protein